MGTKDTGRTRLISAALLLALCGVVLATGCALPIRYSPEGNALSGCLAISDNAGRYAAEIGKAADRYGLHPDLVYAVIQVESAFSPSAVSRKGAQGLMQLMPQTASLLGVRDAFNPRQNIHGGVRHLRGLILRYRGNLPLALAAYNTGDRVVDRYRGIPPYPETQQYVQQILSLFWNRLPRSHPQQLRPDLYTTLPPTVRVVRWIGKPDLNNQTDLFCSRSAAVRDGPPLWLWLRRQAEQFRETAPPDMHSYHWQHPTGIEAAG